jgi:hypothetical protein
MYLNVNNPVNYQLQGFGQNGVRTISTDQLYIQGEYYRVLVAEEDSYVTAVSVLGDDLTAEFVYAGTTIYGLFTEVSVTSGSLTAYIAGPTDIEDVWAYINAYGEANAARIEAADCAKDAIAPLLDKYYAKASLVMVPSLYKTSIVYSERPLTTDGQLAFTRSNDTATRVGPDGLIEKVRTNLLPYSNDFSNAAWTKTNGGVGIEPVVTPNYTTDPFGGNNGWRLQCDLNGGTTSSDRSWLQQIFAGTTVPTTASVYAKLNSAGTATFAVTNGSTDNVTITSTDWVRVSSVRTASPASYIFRIGLIGNNGQSDSIDISIAFAQLETGDIATDYIPTTTAAVSVGPVANLPRLNYPINSDGSVGCPSLLLEPQRTNLNPYSEQFDNAEWDTYATSYIPTLGASVTRGADACSKTGISSLIGQTLHGELCLWYRISATQTAAATTTGYILYLLATADGVVTYAGDVTKGAFVYGGMTEAASYATSYIPTLGAAVTRGADACSKTGISSLIGQTQGTLFVELANLTNYFGYIGVDDTSNNNRVIVFGIGDSRAFVQVRVGGTILFTTSTPVTSGSVKLALAYSSAGSVFYANGVQIGTNATSVTYSGLSQFTLNQASQIGSIVNQALLFKTRLTNQELQDLTTL